MCISYVSTTWIVVRVYFLIALATTSTARRGIHKVYVDYMELIRDHPVMHVVPGVEEAISHWSGKTDAKSTLTDISLEHLYAVP